MNINQSTLNACKCILQIVVTMLRVHALCPRINFYCKFQIQFFSACGLIKRQELHLAPAFYSANRRLLGITIKKYNPSTTPTAFNVSWFNVSWFNVSIYARHAWNVARCIISSQNISHAELRHTLKQISNKLDGSLA